MASTLSLQNSMNFTQSFGGFRGLNIGAQNEPAVTSGNMIVQTMLSPPFTWNWNRNFKTFLIAPGQQDYKLSLADFGFIEKASYIPAGTITNTVLTSNVATYTAKNGFGVGDLVTVTGSTNGAGVFNIISQPITTASSTQFTVAITNANVGTAVDTGTAVAGKYIEIGGVQGVLGTGNETGSPAYVAPQLDNNASMITFRVLPVPDQTYQLHVIYQKRIPALMSGPASTWAPIPDHYSYIYQYGFLCLMLAYFEDSRWASFSQKFMAALLGAAEGLEEEQRVIFQKAWLDMVSERQVTGMRAQQGVSQKAI